MESIDVGDPKPPVMTFTGMAITVCIQDKRMVFPGVTYTSNTNNPILFFSMWYREDMEGNT